MDKLDTLNLNNNKIEELGPRFFEGGQFSHNRACVDVFDTVVVHSAVEVELYPVNLLVMLSVQGCPGSPP